MKVNRISSVCSTLKSKVAESRFAKAYNVYKYYNGSICDSAIENVTDMFQGMSFRRAFLRLISKVNG